ncbi:MAG: YggS family pyridoxal phosphate-dependent enzyme [Fidelibacterota bacterium]
MIKPGALKSIREKIEMARIRAGREGDPPVEIVAVTKAFPAGAIAAAYGAGLRTIGETRIQDATEKFREVGELPGLKRRLIGHLQSNKAGKAADCFDWIDSVDSVKLGRRLSSIAGTRGKAIPVLVQVNTARDPAKFGFGPEQTEELLELLDLPGLKVGGLMTIGALTEDEAKIRRTFRDLRELRDLLNEQLPAHDRLSELSMGMTGDFEIAVEEGATMVRIGTALFGPRPS